MDTVIDMKDYRVIYENVIYNCICMKHFIIFDDKEKIAKVDSIICTIINNDNRLDIIEGKEEEFRFIRR